MGERPPNILLLTLQSIFHILIPGKQKEKKTKLKLKEAAENAFLNAKAKSQYFLFYFARRNFSAK